MNSKILVSACLLGAKVRYNGTGVSPVHPILQQWQDENRIISFCPEVSAGLPIPRPPAEIQGENGGLGVIDGSACIVNENGNDITEQFLTGAHEALALVKKHNIKMAILKARSPSCGNKQIYDGSFSSALKTGQGVTAALLIKHGCKVFNEEYLDHL